MAETEQDAAEDVAWLHEQMQTGYAMAGRYKRGLELILADCREALAKQEPHLYSVALRSACLEAQEALDDTRGRAARPAPMNTAHTVEYADGECGQIIAVFTSEALARAFWAALPPGRWGDYTVCQEHCDVREYPVLAALPDTRRYAGRRPARAGADLHPAAGARL